MPSKLPDFYVVIGASAGGLNATTELVSQLSEKINASVFIVLHLSKVGMGDFLVHRLQKYTNYTCMKAVDGDTISAQSIYVAPPDKHLIIKEDKIVLANGPAENRWRPSIDVLFRSAAVAHLNKVIGIVLTGYLNDGTAGMLAIQNCGGHTIVQDPNEAEYPDMPLSVLENMEVDHCVSLAKMGETIQKIIRDHSANNLPAPEPSKEVLIEADIAERSVVNLEVVSQLGEKSMFSCPDCGGGLWQIEDGSLSRYRCHIGHSYTEDSLAVKQAETLESTLWVALRMMEERRNLLKTISSKEHAKGFTRSSKGHWEKAIELEEHIERLKQLLFKTKTAE